MKLTLTQQLREWANCVYADDSPALAATMREAAEVIDAYEEEAEMKHTGFIRLSAVHFPDHEATS